MPSTIFYGANFYWLSLVFHALLLNGSSQKICKTLKHFLKVVKVFKTSLNSSIYQNFSWIGCLNAEKKVNMNQVFCFCFPLPIYSHDYFYWAEDGIFLTFLVLHHVTFGAWELFLLITEIFYSAFWWIYRLWKERNLKNAKLKLCLYVSQYFRLLKQKWKIKYKCTYVD